MTADGAWYTVDTAFRTQLAGSPFPGDGFNDFSGNRFQAIGFSFHQSFLYVARVEEGTGRVTGYVGVPVWSYRVTVLHFVALKVGIYTFTAELFVVLVQYACQLVPSSRPQWVEVLPTG